MQDAATFGLAERIWVARCGVGLAVAADDEVVAVGAVEAEDIEDDEALGGVDDLADAEKRFALGDAEKFGGARVGDGGVDFFVGITEFDTVFPL
jgi:hypothetical protein